MEKRELAKLQKDAKTRQGGKPRRSRASWPKPEFILSLLRDGRISSVRELCRELAIDYYVIACYRKEIPEFGAEYEKLIQEAEYKKQQENPNYKSLKEIVSPGNWKERFLHEYSRSHKREAARIFADVDATVVEDALDPASTEYDKEFSEKLRSLEISRRWIVKDTLWDLGMGSERTPQDKTIFRDLLRLEFPESFGRQNVLVNNGVITGISGGANQKAIGFLKELFEETESREIIEVEDVEEIE